MLDAALQDLLARILVPGVLGLAGLITIAQWAVARSRHKWPSVEGEVEQVRIDQVEVKGRRRFVVAPRVRYRVKDRELVTETITLKPIYYRKKEEAEVVAGVFAPGQKRRVWFDPAGSGRAYLVPGGGVGSTIYLVLGLCLVAADAAITVWLLSMR